MVSGGFQYDAVAAAFVAGATVPLSDRGFRYGMLVFETLVVARGQLILSAEHGRLLERGASACGLGVPPALWIDAASRLVRDFPDGVLRVYLTAGDGSPLDPIRASRLFAAFQPMEIAAGAFPPERIATVVPVHFSDLPWVKTGNYWPWIQAANAAEQDGESQTALLVDPEGWICSGAMANVFAVMDGQLITPPAGSRVRPGAVREWIIRRFGAVEQRISAANLKRIRECFLSNSRLPVQVITAIDGVSFPQPVVAQAVWAEFQDKVFNEKR